MQNKLNEKATFYLESSEKDYDVMMSLFASNHFNWALFVGHLVIEKLLKSILIIRKNELPPMTHDLRRLANIIELDLSDEHRKMFDMITSFNISTRYDDIKSDFYKICNEEFSVKWLENIKVIRLWLKSML